MAAVQRVVVGGGGLVLVVFAAAAAVGSKGWGRCGMEVEEEPHAGWVIYPARVGRA